MTWLLPLLLTTSAPAAPGDIVAVDSGAVLYTSSRDAGRRLRMADIEGAAPHTPTPVALFEVLHEGPTFLEVKPLNMPPSLTEGRQTRAPTVTPDTWNHCYPPPGFLAQVGTLLYVKRTDLLQILTRDVTVAVDDGSTIRLDAGLAVLGGRDGVYRVQGHHLRVTTSLPADALAASWRPQGTRTLAQQLRFAEGDGELTAAHPHLRPRLSALDGSLTVRSPAFPPDPERDITRLVDRCIDLQLTEPVGMVPDDSEAKESTWPILAPEGAMITWEDGTPFGQVRRGQAPIWSMDVCTWEPERGTCCYPPSGVEIEAPGVDKPGICYVADFPELDRRGTLKGVFTRLSEEHAQYVAAFASGARKVQWSVVKVDGPVSVEDMREPLEAVEEMFDHCYLRGLQANPQLRGDLEITFVTMPNGRVRYTDSQWNQADDEETAECLERLIQRMTVLDQIGFDPTTTTVRFGFRQDTAPATP